MDTYEYRLALDHLEMAYKMSQKYLSLNHQEVIRTANNYAVALAWNGRVNQADSVLEDMLEKILMKYLYF